MLGAIFLPRVADMVIGREKRVEGARKKWQVLELPT